MEQIIVTAVIFVIGIGIGALVRDIVRTVRQETAFTRRYGESLDETLARFRGATGVPVGVIDPFPEPASRRTETTPQASDVEPNPEPVPDGEREVVLDDGDAYPHNDARVSLGAARLPFEPRGDADTSSWHVNPPYETQRPGAHRAEPEPDQAQTRDLSSFVGVAAPPGAAA